MNWIKENFRLETLLSLWLENENGDLDKVTIQPMSTFERSYKEDVLGIATIEDRLLLQISREGLYDMLPEGVFHEGKRKSQKTTEESVEETLRYKQEERAARKFFLPLEQEYYRQKVWLEHLEIKSSISSISAENTSMFLQFWGVEPDMFSDRQRQFLLGLFPNIHCISGNLLLCAYCLEVLLDEKVSISTVSSQDVQLGNESNILSALGNTVLGVDAVLGNNFSDDENSLTVHIGPVPVERVHAFLQGSTAERQLKVLYGFLFSAETDVDTNIQVESAQQGFAFRPEEGSFARLDYTTAI